jgi:hypothetical protein
MHKYLLAVVLAGSLALLFGCPGSTPKMPDAPPNQAFGAKCNTDSNMSTECMSGICTNSFDMLGYDVCSQMCTMFMANDPTCPVPPGGSGSSGFCNKKGYCRPF